MDIHENPTTSSMISILFASRVKTLSSFEEVRAGYATGRDITAANHVRSASPWRKSVCLIANNWI